MLGNRAMIGKLSGFFVSGSRSRVADMGSTTSPRGPLDLKVESQSPRGLRKYDVGGVGLGIVAALEKSNDCGREILEKYAFCCSIMNRCCPKPSSVSSSEHSSGFRYELEDFDSSEDYTYVTCHGHNNSITKVYYDGACPPDGLAWQHRDGFERFNHLGQFKNAQNRCSEYPVSDSLSSCHLCRKNLQGKDIYMYRGEKGFCSPECRSRQIVIDEHKEVEQCRPKVSRSAEYVSTSSYSKGQTFSTGIFAI